MNRVDDPHFPDTIYDVIYQKNQFSGMYGDRITRCYVKDELVQLVREELENRLTKSGRYDEETIDKLMDMAEEDISCANLYDYVIINEDVNKAVSRLAQIIHGHRYSRNSMKTFLDSYIEGEIKQKNKAVSDILQA